MSAIAIHARASPTFAHKLAASRLLLRQVASEYCPLMQASSLGCEDMVVTHLIADADLPINTFVLETGMLHAETLALIGRAEARYDRKFDLYRPDAAVASKFIDEHGPDAMYDSIELRKACCGFRKMEPLARALAGKQGWITGLRREQSSARSEVPDVEHENITLHGQSASRAKINPLAEWTIGDVWHFIAEQNIPYNPLHDAFFPSIGCAPCTRAVTPGEDVRSGRWWWENEDAKECGLHSSGASTALQSTIIPIRPVTA